MILDLTGDVEDVETSCIVSTTRAGYLLTLCAFMGFLLDKAPIRLKDDVRQALETADTKDKALVNPRMRARRPNLYAATKLELNKMTRTDDEPPKRSLYHRLWPGEVHKVVLLLLPLLPLLLPFRLLLLPLLLNLALRLHL